MPAGVDKLFKDGLAVIVSAELLVPGATQQTVPLLYREAGVPPMFFFKLTNPDDGDSGKKPPLSTGAIVGIVIGGLAGAALVGWALKRCLKPQHPPGYGTLDAGLMGSPRTVRA